MSFRLEKFASTLRQALGEILGRESLDPGLQRISVTRVVPAPDLKRATVFIACPPGEEAAALQHLAGAAGFIKKLLAHKMRLRAMPGLDFAPDAALDLQRQLDGLFPHGALGKDPAPGVGADPAIHPTAKKS
jgi:ribosome-binding factor A